MNTSDLQKVAAKLPLSKSVLARNTEWVQVNDAILFKPLESPTPVNDGVIRQQRIRQSKKPLLNKLETEWFRLAEADGFIPQAIRFRLGNGIWYKPDGFNPITRIAVEIKGPHSFRGGFENLKVAAGLYPMIRWRLLWKDKMGQWTDQDVLP